MRRELDDNNERIMIVNTVFFLLFFTWGGSRIRIRGGGVGWLTLTAIAFIVIHTLLCIHCSNYKNVLW